jgi:hypothetical protein
MRVPPNDINRPDDVPVIHSGAYEIARSRQKDEERKHTWRMAPDRNHDGTHSTGMRSCASDWAANVVSFHMAPPCRPSHRPQLCSAATRRNQRPLPRTPVRCVSRHVSRATSAIPLRHAGRQDRMSVGRATKMSHCAPPFAPPRTTSGYAPMASSRRVKFLHNVPSAPHMHNPYSNQLPCANTHAQAV